MDHNEPRIEHLYLHSYGTAVSSLYNHSSIIFSFNTFHMTATCHICWRRKRSSLERKCHMRQVARANGTDLSLRLINAFMIRVIIAP